MKIRTVLVLLPLLLIFFCCQEKTLPVKSTLSSDSIVYRITFRDTTIYRFDTIRIKHFIHTDTLWTPPALAVSGSPVKTHGVINPNNFGIGPSVGAYYSPYNGFDVNFGFSIQYYILSIPTFRKPHMGRRRNK